MNSIPVLYENEEILVINKPAGLAVQGGNGISHSLDKDFSQTLGYKIFLVHRLDRDTSGLMIVAKSAFAANKWTKLIGSKAAKKEYLALCAGTLKNKSGVIKDDLIQHGESKSAVTYYNVEKQWNTSISPEYSQEITSVPLSLIRLKLETGRMHQIRIHLAKQNCPIAGDDQHGNFKINKLLKKQLKVKRLMLASVKLTMPIDGKEMVFEIPLPEDFPVEQ
ncbi:MAG: RluA family pseudouridine synthase [Treponema sp.]|nr:RluA family pseudouridine synthase [Treponema sp.]MDY4985980.1 RluA family pseudouridine synthase [Treponema sp.]